MEILFNVIFAVAIFGPIYVVLRIGGLSRGEAAWLAILGPLAAYTTGWSCGHIALGHVGDSEQERITAFAGPLAAALLVGWWIVQTVRLRRSC